MKLPKNRSDFRWFQTSWQCQLELDNPAEADRLSAKEGDMYRILRSIHFDEPDHSAALVAQWAPLLKDDAKFWSSFDG